MSNRQILKRVRKLAKDCPQKLPRIKMYPCIDGTVFVNVDTGEEITDEKLIDMTIKTYAPKENFGVLWGENQEEDRAELESHHVCIVIGVEEDES